MLRTGSAESLDQEPIGKVVGRRKTTRTTLEDADQLLRTAWALRGTDKLVPGGLYRFETFEEADRWMTQMMARTHARQAWKMSPASTKPSMTRKPGMS
ncbi:MAG: hypothetical protein JF614_25185 [Acidobacteria bacterium]|nr:hypothetical protein [Acidobacteriota bacterium]